MSEYLTNLPTETVNEYGLTKTLFTRRETIYLKHLMKTLFDYGTEDDLNKKLEVLQFKNLFQYIQFLTDKLRGIYKIPREVVVSSADDIIKTDRNSIFRVLCLYKTMNPLIILDFDKTITNIEFHPAYLELVKNYNVIINSANPLKDVIEKYLVKYNMPAPNKICANKGKQKKIVNLKAIAMHNIKRPIFYIDDELEYLEYGNLLNMYCYEYKNGKIINRTLFIK